MAWAAPTIWTLGVNPSHTQLNQDLISNPLSLRSLNDAAIRVYRTTSQAIPNNSRLGTAVLSWQAAAYQTGITWSAGVNGTKLIVNTTGTYLLEANIRWITTPTDPYGIGYRINGGNTAWDLQRNPGNGSDDNSGMELVFLRAGDYVEVYGFQQSGSSKNAIGGGEYETSCSLSLFAVGNRIQVPRWVAPRTWTDGEKIQAATLQTQLHDEPLNLRNFKGAGAKVWLSKDQSISSDSRGVITWDRSVCNVGNIWDGGSKFIATVDGIYLALMAIEWDDEGVADVQGMGYAVNGSATGHRVQYQDGSNGSENMAGADTIRLLKGDYVEFFAYQDSDESLSINGGGEDKSRCSLTLWAASH